MNELIIKRLDAALDRLEDMEHRINIIIEGNRQQLSHFVDDLRLKDLRHELRNIRQAMVAECQP